MGDGPGAGRRLTGPVLAKPPLFAVLLPALLLPACGDASPGGEGPASGADVVASDTSRAGLSPADAGPDDAAWPVTVQDAAGRTLVFEEPPNRIVSLVPAATATLLALGAGDRIVARTDFDTVAALRPLPSVGGGLRPSAETLLSLRPDLVIRFRSEADVDTPERLDRVGIRHLAVHPELIAEVRSMIRTVGRVVDRRAAADSLLEAQRGVLQDVRARAEEAREVAVAFLVGADPLWVAGSETFIGELLEIAGARNVFGDLGRPYGAVSPEAVLARDPEILLAVEGTEVDERLLRGRQLVHVSPEVEIPGPDLAEAALEIERALRGGAGSTPP